MDKKPSSLCKLRTHLRDVTAPSADEVLQLLNECEAHRNELEAHNEELRSVQQQLERYRDRYINLYDFAPLGYVTLDEDGYVQEINLSGAKMLVAERDTLIGYSFLDFVADQNSATFLDHVHKCISARQEATTEIGLIDKDGRILTVQLRSMPVEETDQEVTFCKTAITDITERHQAEVALRQAEERLRFANTAAKLGTWQWDLAADVLTADERAKVLLGLSATAELNREVLFKIIHPDDHEAVLARLSEAQANPGDYESEFRVVWPNGSMHWIYAKGRSTHDDQQRAYLTGVSMDLTDRKRVEEQVRILSRFPEENPHPVLRIARDGTIIYANRASVPLLAAWGHQQGQKVSGECWEKIIAALNSGLVEKIEVTCNGQTLLCTLAPVVEADYVNLYVSDITELRLAQQRVLELERERRQHVETERDTIRDQLVRQTRLATIGQAYAGIAHELRNPLWAIHNGVFLLKRGIPDKHKSQEYLAAIDRELETARQIIDHVMAMSRGEPPVKTVVDLRTIVTVAQQRLDVPKGIEWHYSAEPDPFLICADAILLEQVFQNLFVNSLDAMGSSGKITVKATRSKAGDEIIVADTGPGIPAQDWDRIFEPLVTMKPEGTGLALAIGRQIVECHGGTLQLLKTDAPGAVFDIHLPVEPVGR
jgi:PAS domain S-box-containing protein